MKKRQVQLAPAPYNTGEKVILLATAASKRYGVPGAAGEVLASVSDSTWVCFKRARGDRDVWVPNQFLAPVAR